MFSEVASRFVGSHITNVMNIQFMFFTLHWFFFLKTTQTIQKPQLNHSRYIHCQQIKFWKQILDSHKENPQPSNSYFTFFKGISFRVVTNLTGKCTRKWHFLHKSKLKFNAFYANKGKQWSMKYHSEIA